MKNKITLTAFIALFSFIQSIGQISTSIVDVLVNNQTTINDCSLIDFGSTTNNSLTVYFKLTKPSNQSVETTTVIVYLKYSSSTNPGTNKGSYSVPSTAWTNGDTQFEGQIPINISASEIQVTGSSIYAKVDSESCEYPLTKTPTPTFELANDSYSIPCGSTADYTFTVNNVYNSPGTLSYSWNVGTGWKRNGFDVSGTITTSTNSITLVPNSTTVLPSNVSVTTTLNGQTYGTETATVSRSAYNPIYQISGNNQLCSTATYSVNNLPSGTSVTSWSCSDTNIATILVNGNQATLIANGYGTVNIIATITNACGQSKSISKTNIHVGAPTINNYNISGGSSSVFTDSVSYFSVSPATGATSYYWWITPSGSCSAGSGSTINNVNPYTTTSTSVMVNWGDCPGTYSVVCKAQNNCGATSTGQKFVTVNDPNSDPCNNSFALKISPNPNKGNKKVDVTISRKPNPEPCTTLVSSKTSEPEYHLEIYDFYGQKKYSGNFKSENISLDKLKLKKGIYILTVTNTKGKIISEKLVID